MKPINEVVADIDKTAKAVFDMHDKFVVEYDARILFATYTAVIVRLGLALRDAEVYKVDTLLRLLSEAGIEIVTAGKVPPKIFYGRPEDTGTKQ